MAKTDRDLASAFQTRLPETFGTLQELIMAMASYQKKREKRTIFGRDKEPKAYKRFEAALRETLSAMVADRVVTKKASAEEYREALLEMLEVCAELFPRWRAAYEFADEFFVENATVAEERIGQMVKRRSRLQSLRWIWVTSVRGRSES